MSQTSGLPDGPKKFASLAKDEIRDFIKDSEINSEQKDAALEESISSSNNRKRRLAVPDEPFLIDEVPAKRGRGRPPKKKRPVPLSSHDGLEALDNRTGDDGDDSSESDDQGPAGQDQENVNVEDLVYCAALDQSDTGNAFRLIRHFGHDLKVLQTEGALSEDFKVWDGRCFDGASGNDKVIIRAQRIGPRIALEANHLRLTKIESEIVEKAREIKSRGRETRSIEDEEIIASADKVPFALEARKASRRRFGVSARNKNRLRAMLDCAAPHLTVLPNDFDSDPLLVATQNHTLRFVRERVVDLECPDPDVIRYITTARVEAILGHRREDLITKVAPVTYDPDGQCPKWLEFITRFQPDANRRRFLQCYSGLGLTGISPQKVVFHYGNGANGKSVFQETIFSVLGPLGVELPAASIVGDNNASGHQASPDIARLHGARAVRILELPANAPVKEELVKAVSGGERILARNLFKGFFTFAPVFVAHLSGNAYPRIDGTDNGIWRRIAVIHWPITLADDEQRLSQNVVAEFMTESSGILNWLIEGVIDYLVNGLIIPDSVRASTQEYRDEMDPIGQFIGDCVEIVQGQNVQARFMYDAYSAWSAANAKRALSENKFGRVLKARIPRDDTGSRHTYLNCKLHNVPDRPMTHSGFPDER